MKYLIPIFLVLLIFIFFQKLVEVRCSSLITNMFFVCSVGKIIGKFMWWNSYFGKIAKLYTAAYGNKSLVTYFHRFYLPFREISRILLESPPPSTPPPPPPKKKNLFDLVILLYFRLAFTEAVVQTCSVKKEKSC